MGIGKNLNVNLRFTADTTAVQSQLKTLQTTLNSLTNVSKLQNLGVQLKSSIMPGVQAATQLQTAFTSSMQNGQLNLAQFNNALKNSGTNIVSLGRQMMTLGPQGAQAFKQMATAIQQAQIPLTKTKTLLTSAIDYFGNVMKWHLASSAINTVSRGLQDAFSYAEDLNESLNNIRIVTGYSVDQMSAFAKEANKASKALKTSTTAYTDASLIYYQQGLKGNDVTERAETTLKLANVTRESAETVSQWMTSIWNNFYDGSKSLEYYADVMTALGAATASSSDEIAEGLEKFAAVAGTVGLSYEYATTALATITAQTRQSADVVGTALKTLFARIQDLELGETLEDGTTLGAYSDALRKVGINIKDASGGLKDMDNILNEMGAKWQQIDKDQQVALAKSVAGIRQYTQLIALMDNWDSFQINLSVAEASEGTLQEQQNIWAESWEGAKKRVQASTQGLYDELIDDEFFIDLNNSLADLIDIFKLLVDSMGGLKGFLPLIVTAFLQLAGPKIVNGLRNMSQEMAMTNKTAQEEIIAMKELALITAQRMGSSSINEQDMELRVLDLQKQSLNISRELTKSEQDKLNGLFQNLQAMQKITAELEEQARLKKEQSENLFLSSYENVDNENKKGTHPVKITEQSLAKAMSQKIQSGNESLSIEKAINKAVKAEDKLLDVKDQKDFDKIKKEIEDQGYDTKDYYWNEEKKKVSLNEGAKGITNKVADEAKESFRKSFKISDKSRSQSAKNIEEATDKMVENARATNTAKKASEGFNKSAEDTQKVIAKLNKKPLGETFVQGAAAVSSMAMGVSSLTMAWKTAMDAFEQGELTFDQLLSIVMSLSMGLPAIINGFKMLGQTMGISQALTAATVAIEKEHNKTLMTQSILSALNITTKKAENGEIAKTTSLIWAEYAAEAFKNGEKKKGILACIAAKAASILEAVGLGFLIPVKYAEAAASGTAAAATWAMILPIGVLVLAIAGLTLGIIGLVKFIQFLSDSYNADAIAAEKAAQASKDAAEAFNAAKEAYDQLKESVSAYEEAQMAIETLTEGTDEWREAIFNANQQVTELLDKYPELINYVKNTNGRLTIDSEGFDTLLDQQSQNVAIMQNASMQANLAARQARTKANRTDALRNELDTYGWGNAIAEGRLITGVGTAITNNELAYRQMEQALSRIENAYKNKGEDIFTNFEDTLTSLEITSDELRETLLEEKDVVEQLVREQKKNLDLEKLYAQAEVDNLLNSQENFVSSLYGGKIQERALELYDNRLKNTSIEGVTNQELGEKWAEKQGISADKVKNVKEDGDYLKITIIENDSEVEKSVSKTAAEKIYKTDQIDLAALTREVNAFGSFAQNLTSSTDKAFQALGHYLKYGDFSTLDLDLLKGLKSGEIKLDAVIQDQKLLDQWGVTVVEASEMLQTALNNISLEEAARNIEIQRWKEYNNIIKATAEELKMSESALQGYASLLTKQNKALKDYPNIAAKVTKQHYKLAQGVVNLRGALEDNIELLNSDNPLEYAEGIGAIKDAMDQMFGTNVTSNFVKEYLSDIQAMVNGSEEAFERVRQALIEDFVISLQLDPNAENTLKSEMARLMEDINNNDYSIGAKINLDNAGAIQALNDAMAAGKTTIDEIQNMFSHMGISLPDTEIKWYEMPQTTRTLTHTEGFNEEGEIFATGHEVLTTSFVSMPWIGDNPPTFSKAVKDSETGAIKWIQDEGTGVNKAGSSLQRTASGNSYKDILNYDPDGDLKEKEKSKKKFDEEIDRYHELKEAIDDVTRELDQLSTAKDRAFGKAKLKYMDAEIEKLEEQIALQDELASRMELDLAKDQAELNRWGFSTDASGRISNYEEVYAQRLAEYNSLMMTDKDTADEKWEEFEKAVEQYEETLNGLEDAQAEAINLRYELEEKRLENIQTIVEDNIELTNDKLATLEYQMSKIEDDAFAAADAIALIGQQTDAAVENLKHYESGIREVLKMETANGSRMTDEEVDRLLKGDTSVLQGKELTSNQIEALREYRDNIYETNQELQEYADSINEKVVEYFEAANEKLERQGELLERNQKILENYRNIIDLVGADNLGISSEVISRMNQQMVKNADATLQHARIMRDQTKAAYEEAAAAGILSEEELNTLYDAYLDAEENFNDSWVSALEAASEAFENEVQRILDNFDKALGGLEEKLDWFEKLQERNEIFYKDYEKTYEISKLNRQIAESIDTTDNLRGQRALTEIQRELLKYQEQGKELSKYDLEYLQKKYDLELARIALEEAQNAKSQVRLTRDSAGNYGYMYTADANAVANAEQTYEDKLYELEKFLDESSKDVQKYIMSLSKEWADAIAELDENDPLYREKLDSLTEYYTSLMSEVSREAEELLAYGKEMNEEYGTHAAEVFNETIMGKLYTDINSYQEFNAGMQEAISTTLKDLEDNHSNYRQNVSDIFDTAGQDIEDFKDDVVEYLGEVDQANKDILETTGSMAQEMSTDFDAIIDVAQTFQQRYDSMIRPLIELNKDVADSITGLIAAYEALDDPAVQAAVQSALDKMSEGANDKTIAAEQSGSIFDGSNTEPEADPFIGNYVKIINSDIQKELKHAGETNAFKVTGKNEKDNTYQLAGYGSINADQITLTSAPKTTTTLTGTPLLRYKFTGTPTGLVSYYKDKSGSFGAFENFYAGMDFYATETVKTADGRTLAHEWDQYNKKPSGYWVDITGSHIFNGIKYISLDTGGYTGTWGPEGRLAMLHQKELVLNAQDTENFLTAIQIVRSMADQLEANARAAQYGMTEIRAAAGLPQQGTLEQNVHIEASFPNATNHSEIEEAFGNLVNLAAQYANRK